MYHHRSWLFGRSLEHFRAPLKRRSSLAIRHVGAFRPPGDYPLHHVQRFTHNGNVQRRPAVMIPNLKPIGAHLEHRFQNVSVTVLRRPMDGCLPVAIGFANRGRTSSDHRENRLGKTVRYHLIQEGSIVIEFLYQRGAHRHEDGHDAGIVAVKHSDTQDVMIFSGNGSHEDLSEHAGWSGVEMQGCGS